MNRPAHRANSPSGDANVDVESVRITVIEPGTDSARQREALYRFRYEIYVREMKRTQHYADHVSGRIEDPLDVHGVQLVAWVDDAVVGCARVNFASDGGLAAYEALYDMPAASPDYPAGVCIVTRLMVAAPYRGGELTTRMFRKLYRLCLERGARHGYMDCNAHLVPLFERFGFVAHVAPRMHPEYGRVHPMRLDLYDDAHLARVESPFLPVLRAYRGAAGTAATRDFAEHARCEIERAFDTAFARFDASPVMRRLAAHALEPRHYAAMLREMYHYTKENPQIQALAAVYFRGADREHVRAFFKHASAEIGHDLMALADLRTLGYDTCAVPEQKPLPSTVALTSFPFYQIVYRNPIGYLGYLYFLEHMPTRAGAAYAAALLGCGVPREALSFLAEHTTVDVAHNALMRRYVDTLVRTEADLSEVIYAIHVTAELYANMLGGAAAAADAGSAFGVDHCELARAAQAA